MKKRNNNSYLGSRHNLVEVGSIDIQNNSEYLMWLREDEKTSGRGLAGIIESVAGHFNGKNGNIASALNMDGMTAGDVRKRIAVPDSAVSDDYLAAASRDVAGNITSVTLYARMTDSDIIGRIERDGLPAGEISGDMARLLRDNDVIPGKIDFGGGSKPGEWYGEVEELYPDDDRPSCREAYEEIMAMKPGRGLRRILEIANNLDIPRRHALLKETSRDPARFQGRKELASGVYIGQVKDYYAEGYKIVLMDDDTPNPYISIQRQLPDKEVRNMVRDGIEDIRKNPDEYAGSIESLAEEMEEEGSLTENNRDGKVLPEKNWYFHIGTKQELTGDEPQGREALADARNDDTEQDIDLHNTYHSLVSNDMYEGEVRVAVVAEDDNHAVVEAETDDSISRDYYRKASDSEVLEVFVKKKDNGHDLSPDVESFIQERCFGKEYYAADYGSISEYEARSKTPEEALRDYEEKNVIIPADYEYRDASRIRKEYEVPGEIVAKGKDLALSRNPSNGGYTVHLRMTGRQVRDVLRNYPGTGGDLSPSVKAEKAKYDRGIDDGNSREWNLRNEKKYLVSDRPFDVGELVGSPQDILQQAIAARDGRMELIDVYTRDEVVKPHLSELIAENKDFLLTSDEQGFQLWEKNSEQDLRDKLYVRGYSEELSANYSDAVQKVAYRLRKEDPWNQVPEHRYYALVGKPDEDKLGSPENLRYDRGQLFYRAALASPEPLCLRADSIYDGQPAEISNRISGQPVYITTLVAEDEDMALTYTDGAGYALYYKTPDRQAEEILRRQGYSPEASKTYTPAMQELAAKMRALDADRQSAAKGKGYYTLTHTMNRNPRYYEDSETGHFDTMLKDENTKDILRYAMEFDKDDGHRLDLSHTYNGNTPLLYPGDSIVAEGKGFFVVHNDGDSPTAWRFYRQVDKQEILDAVRKAEKNNIYISRTFTPDVANLVRDEMIKNSTGRQEKPYAAFVLDISADDAAGLPSYLMLEKGLSVDDGNYNPALIWDRSEIEKHADLMLHAARGDMRLYYDRETKGFTVISLITKKKAMEILTKPEYGIDGNIGQDYKISDAMKRLAERMRADAVRTGRGVPEGGKKEGQRGKTYYAFISMFNKDDYEKIPEDERLDAIASKEDIANQNPEKNPIMASAIFGSPDEAWTILRGNIKTIAENRNYAIADVDGKQALFRKIDEGTARKTLAAEKYTVKDMESLPEAMRELLEDKVYYALVGKPEVEKVGTSGELSSMTPDDAIRKAASGIDDYQVRATHIYEAPFWSKGTVTVAETPTHLLAYTPGDRNLFLYEKMGTPRAERQLREEGYSVEDASAYPEEMQELAAKIRSEDVYISPAWGRDILEDGETYLKDSPRLNIRQDVSSLDDEVAIGRLQDKALIAFAERMLYPDYRPNLSLVTKEPIREDVEGEVVARDSGRILVRHHGEDPEENYYMLYGEHSGKEIKNSVREDLKKKGERNAESYSGDARLIAVEVIKEDKERQDARMKTRDKQETRTATVRKTDEGRWHQQEQNLLRGMGDMGNIISDWLRYHASKGTFTPEFYYRDSNPANSLVLSFLAHERGFDNPHYITREYAQEKGIHIFSYEKPVPYITTDSNGKQKVIDLFEVRQTDLMQRKDKNPELKDEYDYLVNGKKDYADNASMKLRKGLETVAAESNWRAPVLVTDSLKDDRYHSAYYDRDRDLVVVLDPAEDDWNDDARKDEVMSALTDSLLLSRRLRQKSPQDAAYFNTTRLMNVINCGIDLSKTGEPFEPAVSAKGYASPWQDPARAADILRTSGAIAEAIESRSYGMGDTLEEKNLINERQTGVMDMREGAPGAERETGEHRTTGGRTMRL